MCSIASLMVIKCLWLVRVQTLSAAPSTGYNIDDNTNTNGNTEILARTSFIAGGDATTIRRLSDPYVFHRVLVGAREHAWISTPRNPTSSRLGPRIPNQLLIGVGYEKYGQEGGGGRRGGDSILNDRRRFGSVGSDQSRGRPQDFPDIIDEEWQVKGGDPYAFIERDLTEEELRFPGYVWVPRSRQPSRQDVERGGRGTIVYGVDISLGPGGQRSEGFGDFYNRREGQRRGGEGGFGFDRRQQRTGADEFNPSFGRADQDRRNEGRGRGPGGYLSGGRDKQLLQVSQEELSNFMMQRNRVLGEVLDSAFSTMGVGEGLEENVTSDHRSNQNQFSHSNTNSSYSGQNQNTNRFQRQNQNQYSNRFTTPQQNSNSNPYTNQNRNQNSNQFTYQNRNQNSNRFSSPPPNQNPTPRFNPQYPNNNNNNNNNRNIYRFPGQSQTQNRQQPGPYPNSTPGLRQSGQRGNSFSGQTRNSNQQNPNQRGSPTYPSPTGNTNRRSGPQNSVQNSYDNSTQNETSNQYQPANGNPFEMMNKVYRQNDGSNKSAKPKATPFRGKLAIRPGRTNQNHNRSPFQQQNGGQNRNQNKPKEQTQTRSKQQSGGQTRNQNQPKQQNKSQNPNQKKQNDQGQNRNQNQKKQNDQGQNRNQNQFQQQTNKLNQYRDSNFDPLRSFGSTHEDQRANPIPHQRNERDSDWVDPFQPQPDQVRVRVRQPPKWNTHEYDYETQRRRHEGDVRMEEKQSKDTEEKYSEEHDLGGMFYDSQRNHDRQMFERQSHSFDRNHDNDQRGYQLQNQHPFQRQDHFQNQDQNQFQHPHHNRFQDRPDIRAPLRQPGYNHDYIPFHINEDSLQYPHESWNFDAIRTDNNDRRTVKNLNYDTDRKDGGSRRTDTDDDNRRTVKNLNYDTDRKDGGSRRTDTNDNKRRTGGNLNYDTDRRDGNNKRTEGISRPREQARTVRKTSPQQFISPSRPTPPRRNFPPVTGKPPPSAPPAAPTTQKSKSPFKPFGRRIRRSVENASNNNKTQPKLPLDESKPSGTTPQTSQQPSVAKKQESNVSKASRVSVVPGSNKGKEQSSPETSETSRAKSNSSSSTSKSASNSPYKSRSPFRQSNSPYSQQSGRWWTKGKDARNSGTTNNAPQSQRTTGTTNNGYYSNRNTGVTNDGYQGHQNAGIANNNGRLSNANTGVSSDRVRDYGNTRDTNSGYQGYRNSEDGVRGYQSYEAPRSTNSGYQGYRNRGNTNSNFQGFMNADSRNDGYQSYRIMRNSDNGYHDYRGGGNRRVSDRTYTNPGQFRNTDYRRPARLEDGYMRSMMHNNFPPNFGGNSMMYSTNPFNNQGMGFHGQQGMGFHGQRGMMMNGFGRGNMMMGGRGMYGGGNMMGGGYGRNIPMMTGGGYSRGIPMVTMGNQWMSRNNQMMSNTNTGGLRVDDNYRAILKIERNNATNTGTTNTGTMTTGTGTMTTGTSGGKAGYLQFDPSANSGTMTTGTGTMTTGSTTNGPVGYLQFDPSTNHFLLQTGNGFGSGTGVFKGSSQRMNQGFSNTFSNDGFFLSGGYELVGFLQLNNNNTNTNANTNNNSGTMSGTTGTTTTTSNNGYLQFLPSSSQTPSSNAKQVIVVLQATKSDNSNTMSSADTMSTMTNSNSNTMSTSNSNNNKLGQIVGFLLMEKGTQGFLNANNGGYIQFNPSGIGNTPFGGGMMKPGGGWMNHGGGGGWMGNGRGGWMGTNGMMGTGGGWMAGGGGQWYPMHNMMASGTDPNFQSHGSQRTTPNVNIPNHNLFLRMFRKGEIYVEGDAIVQNFYTDGDFIRTMRHFRALPLQGVKAYGPNIMTGFLKGYTVSACSTCGPRGEPMIEFVTRLNTFPRIVRRFLYLPGPAGSYRPTQGFMGTPHQSFY